MSNELQRKLSALTASRKVKLEQIDAEDKEIQMRIAEKIQSNLKSFASIKSDLKEYAKTVRSEITPNGDDLLVYANDDASSVADKSRNFINIYIYPKGFSIQTYGVNAPGIYIDCNPEQGTILVQKRVSFTTPDIITVEEDLEVSTVGIEYFKGLLLDTLTEVFEYSTASIA